MRKPKEIIKIIDNGGDAYANEILEISDKNVKAHYWEGGSGEIVITNKDGNELWGREDALLKHHIEALQEQIEEDKKSAVIYKNAISLLKKARAKANKQFKRKVL